MDIMRTKNHCVEYLKLTSDVAKITTMYKYDAQKDTCVLRK